MREPPESVNIHGNCSVRMIHAMSQALPPVGVHIGLHDVEVSREFLSIICGVVHVVSICSSSRGTLVTAYYLCILLRH